MTVTVYLQYVFIEKHKKTKKKKKPSGQGCSGIGPRKQKKIFFI